MVRLLTFSLSFLVSCKILFSAPCISFYTLMTFHYWHQTLLLDSLLETLLFWSINTKDNCRLLQHNIATLEQWERSWQMTFRPDKWRYSISQDHINQFNTHTLYTTNNWHPHHPTNTFEYLINNFTFNTHIDFFTNKATRTLRFLRRNLQYYTPDIKRTAQHLSTVQLYGTLHQAQHWEAWRDQH